MPAAYAHNRFGDECLKVLPHDLQKACEDHYDVFSIGVHGPDILFYHITRFHPDEVSFLGRKMHHEPGYLFFEKMQGMIEKKEEKKLAYLLGFLAHFTLDSHCHGYINRMARTTEYSHSLIESQYDAYLMRLDGKEPIRHNRSKVLKPTREIAEVSASFIDTTERNLLRAMKNQKFVLRMLYSPRQIRKRTVRRFLDIARMNASIGDLFVDNEVVPGLSLISDTIHDRYGAALEDFPFMTEELMGYMDGKNLLGERFYLDFEGKKY